MKLSRRFPLPLTRCDSCGCSDVNAAVQFCRACVVITQTCREMEEFEAAAGGMPLPWRYALRGYVRACADAGRPLTSLIRACSTPRQRELLPLPEAPPLPAELLEPAV
jgi:hypothetical protein